MKKRVLFLLLPCMLNAHTMGELFSALKNHAQTKSDELKVEKAAVSREEVHAKLYPKVDLFAAYDNYATPTGMLPVPPDTLFGMIKDQTIPQPFSYNIYKAGAKFSMPIFIKSLYTMADKAKAMQKSAKAKKRINLLQNEAVLVGSNANLEYLQALQKSLDLKEKSLQETLKLVQIKVNNGRAAASALYKIDDALNQISIAKNSIALQKKKILATVKALTGISLKSAIAMREAQSSVDESEMGALKPLEAKIAASRLDVKAQKEQLYPTVVAHGNYVFSHAKAYNNAKDVNEEYGEVGVLVNIPLLSMQDYTSIKKSRLALHADEIELQKAEDELTAKAEMLKSSLALLEHSIELSDKSVQNKEKLLKIAKVSYKSGRLSIEEYLRYEDDVVDAKAKYYQARAQKWQTLMELAVIYANNIEEMVQ